MKNIVCSFIVAGLFAACGGGSKPAATGPAAAPSCEVATSNIVTQVGSDGTGMSADDFAANRGTLDTALSGECTSAAWSADARTCFAAATDAAALENCATMLTDAQKESMTTTMVAALSDGSDEGTDEGMDEGIDEGGDEGMDEGGE